MIEHLRYTISSTFDLTIHGISWRFYNWTSTKYNLSSICAPLTQETCRSHDTAESDQVMAWLANKFPVIIFQNELSISNNKRDLITLLCHWLHDCYSTWITTCCTNVVFKLSCTAKLHGHLLTTFLCTSSHFSGSFSVPISGLRSFKFTPAMLTPLHMGTMTRWQVKQVWTGCGNRRGKGS